MLADQFLKLGPGAVVDRRRRPAPPACHLLGFAGDVSQAEGGLSAWSERGVDGEQRLSGRFRDSDRVTASAEGSGVRRIPDCREAAGVPSLAVLVVGGARLPGRVQR
jgi:hypothetical protein